MGTATSTRRCCRLLIPRLGLSLAAAGTLTMLFQMAASVAQVGFGHIADRWRPRTLITIGPVVSVCILSLIGLATSTRDAGVDPRRRWAGRGRVSSAGGGARTSAGWRTPGFAMSVYITGGTLGFSLGPLCFAPFAQRFGIEWTPLLAFPGLAVVAVFPASSSADRLASVGAARLRCASTVREAARAALHHRRLENPGVVDLRDVRSGHADATRPVGRRGGRVGRGVSVREWRGRVFWRARSPISLAPRIVIALSLVASTPFLFLAPFLSGWQFVVVLAIGGLFLQSTLPVNVTFGQSLAPVSAATVASLMMGFAWGTGGLSVPFVGLIADRIGIEHTLVGVSVIPLLAAACALPLPARAGATPPSQPAEIIVPETGR